VLTELPFNIRVEFKKDQLLNDKIRSENSYTIVGYMEGKTMFMGKIPLLFTDKAKNTPPYFIAQTMLGSCSEDNMTWRLWLTIENKVASKSNGSTTFFIDFDSTRF
jgi:hypothetical protein